MSQEVLKALAQLFAIITKQDIGVTEEERQFVINFFQTELDQNSVKEYLALYDQFSDFNNPKLNEVKSKTTSVKDSIKTLEICKKFNKTLTQKQKIFILIKLLELIGSDKKFTPQRIKIINTVSTVFNIKEEEYKLIENFIVSESIDEYPHKNLLILHSSDKESNKLHKKIPCLISSKLMFMRVGSVEMYFIKYIGEESNTLNGFIIQPHRVYLFTHGSIIKTPAGDALYYSDIITNFNEKIKTIKLSFNAKIEEHQFSNGTVGLRDIEISEGPGKMIGIMGASGTGKTTLLLNLVGLEKVTRGEIRVNGYNIHTQKNKIQSVVGYVSQDDLLIEELTVYQNLYFNAKLCLAHFSESQIHKRVMTTLANLGLDQLKHISVGSFLNKKISGGQRKRLNIALELIREPAILFLDEPTSGLSSRDSENVIDLLKELSLKGKLIFSVIHQPSSDIYKMFDKMIIMDTGGYICYYGSPVEAVSYFKKATHQVDSNGGLCAVCGNVNAEQIFNIIEAKVVDEYGQTTNKRKVTPQQWHEMFKKSFEFSKVKDIEEVSTTTLHIPKKLQQIGILIRRDFLSKYSNTQYLLINLIESPLLAIILAFIVKYKNAPNGNEYIFRFNDNIPSFLLMSIVVSLFMGLTVSAEEIIHDRKILKRESFLNLSWNSYLLSKLVILFSLSAIQTFLFVIVGNFILEIHSMTWAFWFALFTISCFANILGLNISSTFNSTVAVYITIPLVLVPQLILSGLLFNFDKLHHTISIKGKVPLIADFIASRWAYEALATYQFTNNDFEAAYYNYEKDQAKADFKSTYLADELRRKNEFVSLHINTKNDSIKKIADTNLKIIRNHIENDFFKEGLEKINWQKDFIFTNYNRNTAHVLAVYFDRFKKYYQKVYNEKTLLLEKRIHFDKERGIDINEMKNKHYNESLSDLVKNSYTAKPLLEHNGKLIQQINPIFQDPKPTYWLDYRAPFFAPEKNLLGYTLTTFWFNMIIVWMMSVLLYILLYYESIRKVLKLFGDFKHFTNSKAITKTRWHNVL